MTLISLGTLVKDSITGLAGTAIGRAIYLTASTQIQIQPQMVGPDGAPMPATWIDEARVIANDDEKAPFRVRSIPADKDNGSRSF